MSGKFALIIGNTEYMDPGLARLTAPGKDTADFASVLSDKEVCAFDRVEILLNKPEYEIREAIYDLFNQKKPDDLLLLYFSGHGVRDEFGALYLAVTNTNRSKLGATAVDASFITRSMDQSRSKRQVLILDCCNSGAFAQGTKAATGVSIGTKAAFEGRGYGRVVLTASDSTQFAFEGDTFTGETDNSLFTHFLVTGLKGEADKDSDGRITIDELYDYAYEQIVSITPQQTPGKWSYKQQGEIVLRQTTRMEDIPSVPLPLYLIHALENPDSDVRLGAVQSLKKLLTGKNLGLARAAREVLENLEKEDDSRRVMLAATEALGTLREAEEAASKKADEEQEEAERQARQEEKRLLAEQEAEELRKAEAEQLARLQVEEKRLADEKEKAERVLAEQKAKKEAKRLAALKAKEERQARENPKTPRKRRQKINALSPEQNAEVERTNSDASRSSEIKEFEEQSLASQKQRLEREEHKVAESELIGVQPFVLKAKVAKMSNWIAVGTVILVVFLCVTVGILGMTYFRNQLFPGRTPTPETTDTNGTSTVQSSPTPAPLIQQYNGPRSNDPDTFLSINIGEPETLDPALSYETLGIEIIQNVYETLIFYDGEATDKFVAQLAKSWEISDDGTVYTFHIREDVKFHEGQDLTPEDVAYSFQRGLLFGGYDSPQWLLAEPFFGIGTDDITLLIDNSGVLVSDREALLASDRDALIAACQRVTNAIIADNGANTVTMTLAQPWAPFLPTIATGLGSILDKDWAIANGGWDGSCATWQNYYAEPADTNPLTNIMNGTGAFKLDHWTLGEEIVLVRNDEYWREPAKLERVIIKSVEEWETRYAMLQAGEADVVDIPPENHGQVEELVGERCEFDLTANTYRSCEVVGDNQPLRLHIGRPTNTSNDLFFTFNIAETSNYIGSGQLDGNGIPVDFFSDVHIRKGFAYSFDWDTYINEIFDGGAIQQPVLARRGMLGFEDDAPVYTYDLAKAEEEFKLADVDKDGILAGEDPEGDVWTTGFRLQAVFNEGNTTREAVSEILSANLSTVNELFVMETVGLPWTTYLRTLRNSEAPYFLSGWFEDIHDPHNWYVPYLAGVYATRQQMPDQLKEQFRELINQGIAETNSAKRQRIYEQINRLVYDEVPIVLLAVATNREFEQRWIQGTIRNPIFPGRYYYTIYKQ